MTFGETLSGLKPRSALLCLGALLLLSPALSAAEPENGIDPQSPGSVVVFPEGANPMPDITSILGQLQDSGYGTAGYQTEFQDGRRVLHDLGDGLILAAPGNITTCPAEATQGIPGSRGERPVASPKGGPAADPAAVVKEAERFILLTDYPDAEKRLTQARALLPCQTGPVSRDLLYRIYFMQGLAAYYQDHRQDAERGFQLAQGIDLAHTWDRSYPPPAWEIFLNARETTLHRPSLTFRRNLTASNAEVWIDGSSLGTEDLSVGAGEHLVQVRVPASEGHPAAFRSWLIDAVGEAGHSALWVTDGEAVRRGQAQLREDQAGTDREMVLQLLARWARANHRTWMLIVSPRGPAAQARVLFVNVAEQAVTPAPSWMLRGTGQPEQVTLRVPGKGEKTVQVPSALYGWHVTTGLTLSPSFSKEDVQIVGLEAGGFRRITGRLDAHVALGLGISSLTPVGTTGRERYFYVAVHVGVRKSWEIDPFGLYVEGGIEGCRCRGYMEPGLEARVGTYYKLDVAMRNAIELYGGFGVLPAHSFAGFGQAGFNYQRAF